MTSQLLQKTLLAHNVCISDTVVFGSNAIAASFSDFRDPNDIDIVISLREFLYLWLFRGWKVVFPKNIFSWKEVRLVCRDCEAFLFWRIGRQYFSYKEMCGHSHYAGPVRCADIAWVKRYKRALRREKDIRDLAFLRVHKV